MGKKLEVSSCYPVSEANISMRPPGKVHEKLPDNSYAVKNKVSLLIRLKS
jgi:hypothetical protein